MSLSSSELAKFREWFASFDADEWDKQIEKDALNGRLDALAHAALEEYKFGIDKQVGIGKNSSGHNMLHDQRVPPESDRDTFSGSPVLFAV